MTQMTIHGADGDVVDVIDHHLSVAAIADSEFHHESEERSLAFTWTTVDTDVSAAGTILLVRNTSSTERLHIQTMEVNVDTDTEYDLHFTSEAVFTPAGDTVTGVCLNRSAPKVAEADAKGLESANTQGNVFWTSDVKAGVPDRTFWDGAIILGTNQQVAIDITTAATSLANASISGYYKEGA